MLANLGQIQAYCLEKKGQKVEKQGRKAASASSWQIASLETIASLLRSDHAHRGILAICPSQRYVSFLVFQRLKESKQVQLDFQIVLRKIPSVIINFATPVSLTGHELSTRVGEW